MDIFINACVSCVVVYLVQQWSELVNKYQRLTSYVNEGMVYVLYSKHVMLKKKKNNKNKGFW